MCFHNLTLVKTACSGGSSPQYLGDGAIARAVKRAYNGDLRIEPPAGSRGRAPVRGHGAKPYEVDALLVFGRSNEDANFPTFLKFGNAMSSDDFVLSLQKKSRVATKLGQGRAKLEEPVPPAQAYTAADCIPFRYTEQGRLRSVIDFR